MSEAWLGKESGISRVALLVRESMLRLWALASQCGLQWLRGPAQVDEEGRGRERVTCVAQVEPDPPQGLTVTFISLVKAASSKTDVGGELVGDDCCLTRLDFCR